MMALQKPPVEDFNLVPDGDEAQAFELESPLADNSPQALQGEFFLPEFDPENPQDDGQFEFEGMAKPAYMLSIEGINRTLKFQHAHSLLESLEAQQIQVPYQCREGYCGSCRTELLSGEVAYLSEPMAWINDNEILPCCCVPKSPLSIKLKG
jgi:ferredoxin